jgi:hypothetical protein
MHTVPWTFAGVSVGLGALSWIIGRRQKLARASVPVSDDGAPAANAESESEENS